MVGLAPGLGAVGGKKKLRLTPQKNEQPLSTSDTITNEELCLAKVARWSVNVVPTSAFTSFHCACCVVTYHNTVHFRVTYTPCKISQVELNSPYLRDVFLQYWTSDNPDPKCPFLV